MSVTLSFLGASKTVTGSQYLIATDKARVLVDCGVFQGERQLRERNWHKPAFELSSIDAVLLTHAHIDHSGLLPRYAFSGLHAPIFATPATTALCGLLLPDAGRLNEEEAEYRLKTGRSRHIPPIPLFTEKQANLVLNQFVSIPFHSRQEIAPGVTAEWRRTGHILGAGSILVVADGVSILFSGDVGRYGVPVMKDPEPVSLGDIAIIESTYGDSDHYGASVEEDLAKIITETLDNKGTVIIPAFAVGRTQTLLYYIRKLEINGKIPSVPVIIDSPMAADATSLYKQFPDDYDEETLRLFSESSSPFMPKKGYFIRTRQESIALNSITDPMILISASGMLTGGRILHHLKHRISNPRSTLLFVGFQPPGSRGAWIQSGASNLRIFGEDVHIGARVETISSLSAHAGKTELLKWIEASEEFSGLPKKIFVTHGEPSVAEKFAVALKDKFALPVSLPSHLDSVVINP